MKLRAVFLFFLLTVLLPAVAAAQTSSTGVSKAPLPVCTLRASAGAVYLGDSVNLSWSSQYATGGTITSLGTVGPSGVQGVIPTAYAHTFVGVFTGPGGTGTCSVTVGILQGGSDPGRTDTTVKTGSGLVPCDGINCQACDLASLAQRIINWLVGISIPLAAAMFAYAGIIYFTSGIDGGWNKAQKAHDIFKSVGIGFLIVLCAWLGVQTVLKTVLSPGFYQNWNEIKCVDQSQRPTNKTIQDALNALPFLNTNVSPTTPTATLSGGINCQADGSCYTSGGVLVNSAGSGISCDQTIGCFKADGTPVITSDSNTYGRAGALCADGNLACSPSALEQVYGYEPQEAQAMSCIAITESAGNPYTPDSNTGACGTFQLTNRTSRSNWQNPKYHEGSCSTATSCNDPACNAQAANLMFNEQGYQPWTGIDPNTGKPWNQKARDCVQKYDPEAFYSQVQ